MAVLIFLFGALLALGLFFIAADFLKLPRLATQRAMLSVGRQEKKQARSMEALLMGWAVKLAPHIHMDEYVALCGTSEHAMLWMLEQNPQIRKVALCLDHDEAGIEASGQHEDTLRERGIAAAPLRSQYKDWNADLKALHGLPAEPAEEHPQLLAADPICQRIGAAVSSGVAKPEQAEQKLPILLQDYKNHLHQGRFDRAMDAMELAAAMALSSALREFRQMGKVVSPQQGAERLRQSIQPHHNRGSLKNRADEIAMELQRILAQKASAGICGRESKESLAYRWLELAASCAKVPIRYEADQIKQRQKEEQAQRGAGPVME